ncbi:DNA cytosine methyltransferase [Paenibacillus oralis]|uniref:DNA cytosine methyltransferase n=1 Tax=Paenibacillus oralis TaxID=2490856 RepID=UPI001FE5029E|nr:DNA cytosine methyltransferase [Paenibacillus oralis]
MNEEDKEILIQNREFEEGDSESIHQVHVSSRINKVSGEARPLVDSARDSYASVISVQDKVEICVYSLGGYSRVVVRPLRFKLFNTETFETPSDERIRLLSIAAGAGIGTSYFRSTQYFTPVQEIEMDEDSAENLKLNYPNSFLFHGDLRDCNVVSKADVALVTLPCNEHSSLGDGNQGVFINLTLAAAKIIKAAEPRIVFFENVPAFYKTRAFTDLQALLIRDYPYWIGPVKLESHDFGSIAKRERSYSLAFRYQEDMMKFRVPSPPSKVRRKKLKEFLDSKETEHEWKSLEKWLASFNSKADKNNAWANRSTDLTFVDENATMIQCIPKRYRSHCASNTYVMNPDKQQWRFLTVTELRRIFGIPDDFKFSIHTPLWRIYEQIGQSACGRVFRAFANEIAAVFFEAMLRVPSPEKKDEDVLPFELDADGQLQLLMI